MSTGSVFGMAIDLRDMTALQAGRLYNKTVTWMHDDVCVHIKLTVLLTDSQMETIGHPSGMCVEPREGLRLYTVIQGLKFPRSQLRFEVYEDVDIRGSRYKI